jgi:hypothetical protein
MDQKPTQRRHLFVYAGQIYLGRYVVEKNGDIKAFTPEDKPLGKFPTEKTAVEAVVAAHAGLLKPKSKSRKHKPNKLACP